MCAAKPVAVVLVDFNYEDQELRRLSRVHVLSLMRVRPQGAAVAVAGRICTRADHHIQFHYPRYRLIEEGYDVLSVGQQRMEYKSKNGYPAKADTRALCRGGVVLCV